MPFSAECVDTLRICSCTLTEVHPDDSCFDSEIQLSRIFEEHNQAPYHPSYVCHRPVLFDLIRTRL
jgi:hypothetical protein